MGSNIQLRRIMRYALVSILAIMATMNYWNSDYLAYERFYNYYVPNGIPYYFERGFQFLNYFIYSLGVPFEIFRGVVWIFGLFLLCAGLRRYTTNLHIVLFCYFLTYFLYHVVQIRFFIASSMVIYSLGILSESSRSKFFSIICFIIAINFHIGSILFGILYVAFFCEEKFILLCTISCSVLVVFSAGNINYFKDPILSFLYSMDIRGATATFSSVLNFIDVSYKSFVIYIFSLISSFYLFIHGTNQTHYLLRRYCCFFPLFAALAILVPSGGRWLFPIIMFLFCYLVEDIQNVHGFRKFICILYMLGILIVFGSAQWIPGTVTFDHVTIPIFTYNYFFDMFHH